MGKKDKKKKGLGKAKTEAKAAKKAQKASRKARETDGEVSLIKIALITNVAYAKAFFVQNNLT